MLRNLAGIVIIIAIVTLVAGLISVMEFVTLIMVGIGGLAFAATNDMANMRRAQQRRRTKQSTVIHRQRRADAERHGQHTKKA